MGPMLDCPLRLAGRDCLCACSYGAQATPSSPGWPAGLTRLSGRLAAGHLTEMTDTDFDFDFDVGRRDSSRGSRSDNVAGSGAGNGRTPDADNGARSRDALGDGEDHRRDEADVDPFDALDSGDGNGSGHGFLDGDAILEGERSGDPGATERPLRRRRFQPRAETGTSEDRNGLQTRASNGRDADTAIAADDDWLSLADDPPPGQTGDLDAVVTGDPGPAGPHTPGEGRSLARAARRRATGTSTSFDAVLPSDRRARRERLSGSGPEDFEAALERQSQKRRLARGGSAVVYGLRGLLDDGRRRLQGAGDGVRALRERVPSRPSVPGPGPATTSPAGGGSPPRLPRRIASRRPRKPEPGRLKKSRLAIVMVGLGALALVSTVFGMMVSVAGDLPQLENKAQYAKAKNSEVFDDQGRKIGTLLSNSQRILVESEDISPYIKQAVVAIEDQRFYEHRGVDYQGIARAFVADVMPGGSTQGASTITQQFIKNALEAQASRTYFQKFREAAFAYHLERQWDKDKILTQYLNTIYFGEGAYGIEAAARTYFGSRYPGCGQRGNDPCAAQVSPDEAALLAGIISSPSAYSPRANPMDSAERRNLVLQRMHEQGVLSDEEYEEAARQALPAPSEIEKPQDDSLSPYFTSWLRQQVVDKYGAGRAFGGGLDVHTTLDLDMQAEAESIAYNTLAGIAPTASVVVIDNETGGVKALVGGNDYEEKPFNLATNGRRQPGSAFKPFTLVTAFQNGFTPDSVFGSYKRTFSVPNSKGKELYEVNNYDDTYYGSSSLYTATLHSDNSIFAELGFGPDGMGRKGPHKVADTAHAMGIETEFTENPAMILGGLDPGVTPLEMAYAFSTIARDGVRIGGELDASTGPNEDLSDLAPTAISEVVLPDGKTLDGGKDYKPKEMRAIPEAVAESTRTILRANVLSGTGELAQTGSDDAWGKTGTTENNGDAWFCGGIEEATACVWVGHFDTNTPMETEYNGGPVDGGTFPALIWSQVMQAVKAIYEAQAEAEDDDDNEASESESDSDSESGSDFDSGSSYTPPSSSSGSSSTTGGGGGGGGGSGGGSTEPAPAPAPAAPPPAPSGGGGGSTGGIGGTGGTGL